MRAWLDAYARAWQQADAEAASALFTDDAVYRSHPVRDPHVGTAAICAYWRAATATHEGVEVRFGEPVRERDRVAVEWWTTMRDGHEQVTLPGCLVLRFAGDGRCEELREYWHVEPGRRTPPYGWGR